MRCDCPGKISSPSTISPSANTIHLLTAWSERCMSANLHIFSAYLTTLSSAISVLYVGVTLAN